MKKLSSVLTAGLLVTLVLSGCTSTATTQTTKPTTTQTIQPTAIQTIAVTVTPQVTPTPSPSVSPVATTSTPKQMGYITKAYTSSGKQYITIDYVDMFGGEEAIKQAKADKSSVLEKDEDGKYFIPNDYYIRNVNTLLRTFKIAANCKIELLGDGVETHSATFAQLTQAVKTTKRLVNITLVNNEITSITEYFVP